MSKIDAVEFSTKRDRPRLMDFRLCEVTHVSFYYQTCTREFLVIEARVAIAPWIVERLHHSWDLCSSHLKLLNILENLPFLQTAPTDKSVWGPSGRWGSSIIHLIFWMVVSKIDHLQDSWKLWAPAWLSPTPLRCLNQSICLSLEKGVIGINWA